MKSRTRIARRAALPAFAALAMAAPIAGAVTATMLTTSTLEEEVNVNHDQIRLKTKGATDAHVQQVQFAPGDASAWHDHPGFALIAVKSGTLTLYDADCNAHRVGPGEAFVETGGPTRTVNLGAEPADFFVTYVVPHGSPRTAPAEAPDCA